MHPPPPSRGTPGHSQGRSVLCKFPWEPSSPASAKRSLTTQGWAPAAPTTTASVLGAQRLSARGSGIHSTRAGFPPSPGRAGPGAHQGASGVVSPAHSAALHQSHGPGDRQPLLPKPAPCSAPHLEVSSPPTIAKPLPVSCSVLPRAQAKPCPSGPHWVTSPSDPWIPVENCPQQKHLHPRGLERAESQVRGV